MLLHHRTHKLSSAETGIWITIYDVLLQWNLISA